MTASGQNVAVQIMHSEIHVFDRLALPSIISSKQFDNQEHAFLEMAP